MRSDFARQPVERGNGAKFISDREYGEPNRLNLEDWTNSIDTSFQSGRDVH